MSKKKKISGKDRAKLRLPLDDTKGNGDFKNAALLTLRDGVAAFAGGMAGSAFDKFSLIAGAGTTFAGHYLGSNAIQAFGIGMMAANGYQRNAAGEKNYDNQSLKGFSPSKELGNVKARVTNYAENFSDKLPFSLIFKKKASAEENPDENVSGFGSVADNWNVLEQEEQKILQAAREFQQLNQQIPAPQFSGVEEEESDAEEVEYEELPDNA